MPAKALMYEGGWSKGLKHGEGALYEGEEELMKGLWENGKYCEQEEE